MRVISTITVILLISMIFWLSGDNKNNKNIVKSENFKTKENKIILTKIPRIDLTVNIQTDYILYENYNSLIASSDVIAIVLPQRNLQNNPNITMYNTDGTIMDFYSIASVRILKLIKGKNILPNEIIDVIEPISIIYEDHLYKKLTTEGYAEMLKNKPYVVFLKKNSFGYLGVINMNNGKFDFSRPLAKVFKM